MMARFNDTFRFLSTPSARRATGLVLVDLLEPAISIHALREEGDFIDASEFFVNGQFLSTPSARRATRKSDFYTAPASTFLSTPSARRATAKTEKNISAFVSL